MDEELKRWSLAWKAGPVPELGPRVRRARWASATGLALAWIVVAAVVVGTARAFPDALVFRVVVAFVALFEVAVLGWITWLHLRVPRATSASNAAWLAELRHRQAMEVRVGRTNTPLYVACGFIGAWTPWKLWVDRVGYAAEPWRAVIGVGGMLVLLGLVVVARRHLRARAERALVELEHLAEQLRE